MEDPFKNMHFVSSHGQPVTRQAHRIYHTYMAAWIHVQDQPVGAPAIRPTFKAFRITLDKTGILECEQIDWSKDGHNPAIPQ
jgi:hypothetical protein